MPVAPRLVAELNASLPGAVRRGDAPLVHGAADDRLPTGFAALDAALEGGLPRGQLSELVAAGSTGATSLAHRILGRLTAQTQVAAWVDAPDAFDPASAAAAGVDLERLLWVRPPDLAAAFAATEALLAMGGFPLVVLDAAPRPDAQQRRGSVTAQHSWVRLARAAARARSTLVVLQRAPRRPDARPDGARTTPGAGSAAAVRLDLQARQVVWDRRGGAPSLLDGLVAQVVVVRNRGAYGGRCVLLELG